MLFQITNYVEYIVFDHIVQFKIEFEINKCEFKVPSLRHNIPRINENMVICNG